jgi:hypothetical protein
VTSFPLRVTLPVPAAGWVTPESAGVSPFASVSFVVTSNVFGTP